MRLPLDFSLRNDQHDSVLYLPDGAQALFFEISNIGLEHPITLENKGDTASDENFHFQLLFRPRVLRQIEVIRLNQGGSGVAGSDASIAIAEGANWNLAVSTLDPFNLGGQGGFVVLSLLRIGGGTLDPQSRLPLLLAGLNPDAKLGTRASRVEIKYDAVVGVPSAVPVGGDGAPASAPLQGVVMHHLNLINESRKVFEVAQQVGAVSSAKAGPFQATLIGSNTVVNDGKSSETLRIRVMNPDQDVDVQLDQEDEPTQFRVAWDVVPDDALHGLISSADGDAITSELTDASSFWTSTDGRTIEWGGNGTPTWRKDQSFDLTLNIAKSTAPSGYATIRIAWSHFPGYADGQLVLLVNVGPMFIEEGTGDAPGTIAQGTALPLKLVDKAPLELFRTNFRDQAATGASATNPDATLGFGRNDDLSLVSKSSNGLRIGAANNIGFWTNGNADLDDVPQVSITSDGNIGASGSIGAGSASITGEIGAGSASITGLLTAASTTITGLLTAASATITGLLTAASATITGLLTAENATITDTLEATTLKINTDEHHRSGDVLSVSGDATIKGRLIVDRENEFTDQVSFITCDHLILGNRVGNRRRPQRASLQLKPGNNEIKIDTTNPFAPLRMVISAEPEGELHAIENNDTGIFTHKVLRWDKDGVQILRGSKNFRIPHPQHHDLDLVHASLEGPEVGVYYRGTSRLIEGQATVHLPEYFESLTRLDQRTAILTAVGENPFLLSHSPIVKGQFMVYGTIPDGEFSWEVKAVRADLPELEVEVPALQRDAQNDGADIPVAHIIPTVNSNE